MTYLDLSNENKYDSLLSYVLKTCDEISFHFPILDKATYDLPELTQDYARYQHSKQEFLTELFKHGAKQKISKTYQGIRLGYETQIIRVKLYPKLIDRIRNYHLYDWVWWNALPEDPCFFVQNNCRFVTISHEKIFYACDNKLDFAIIKLMQA